MYGLEFTVFDTCLGWIGIVYSSQGLRKIILFQESKDDVVRQVEQYDSSAQICDTDSFGDLSQRLKRYFRGEEVHLLDKVDFAGASLFQQQVWRVVRTIYYGKTRSYAWVATQLGLPGAARAVGQALGRNPLLIIVPCHRVISSDGGLGGFSAGLEMKKHLLCLEESGTT
jgi:methylated-DNA-[protein]-cysteine S-methyltransferase